MTAQDSATDLLARLAIARTDLHECLVQLSAERVGDLEPQEEAAFRAWAIADRAEIARLQAALQALHVEVRAARLTIKPAQSDLSRSQRARLLGALKSIRSIFTRFSIASHREVEDTARAALRIIEGTNDGFHDPAIDEAARIARNCRDLAASWGEAASAIDAENRRIPADVSIDDWRAQIHARQIRAGVRAA